MLNNKKIEVLKKLKELDIIKYFNLHSFILFLNGDKIITLEYIDLKDYNKVINFFSIYKNYIYYEIILLDKYEFIIIFSFKKEILTFFSKIFKKYMLGDNSYIHKIGSLLGFPECCINKFYNYWKSYEFNRMADNMYSFFLKILKDSKYLKRDLDLFYNRTITHTPCSFDCKNSIDIYKKSKLLLKKNNLDSGLENYNNYKVLFFKSNNYIVLNKGNIIYSGVYYGSNSKNDKYFRYILYFINSGKSIKFNKIPNTLFFHFV